MENKYYTPSIKEFHIGFEYEYKSSEYPEKDWFKYNTPEFNWEREDCPFGKKVLDEFRVKYLNKEDIESLGYVVMESALKFSGVKPFKDKREMHSKVYIYYNRVSKWALITTGNKEFSIEHENDIDKPITRFCGFIKNKSEFIKVISQLDIE